MSQTKQKLIKATKITLKKVSEEKLLTPKEQCQVAHSGQCGVCREDGTFVPCV